MNRTKLVRLLCLLISALIILAIPIVTRNAYTLNILITAGTSIMLAASLRLVLNTGVLHLGQIAFYAIGSYSLAFLQNYLGLSFWLGLPLAGIIAALIAWGLGYTTIRVKGVYFIMVALAFVEIVRLAVKQIPSESGTQVMYLPPTTPLVIPYLIRIEFLSESAYYYMMLVLLAITLAVLYRIEKSQIHKTFIAIMDSEPLAKSIGINITGYTVLAFCICSFFAGIAGAFHASYAGLVSPESFTVTVSIVVFIMVIVGGIGSFWGPIVGAAFLTAIEAALINAPLYQPIIAAIMLILIMIFMPRGLVDLPRLVRTKLFGRIRARIG